MNIRNSVPNDHIQSISEIAKSQSSMIQLLTIEIQEKDKEISRLNNIIDEIYLLFIDFDRNVMKRKYVEANMINLKIKAKLRELKEGK